MEKFDVIAGNFAPHFLGFQVDISVSVSVKSPRHCHVYILLTNRVRGPYLKIRTEFSPLRFMAQAQSTLAINGSGKKKDQ